MFRSQRLVIVLCIHTLLHNGWIHLPHVTSAFQQPSQSTNLPESPRRRFLESALIGTVLSPFLLLPAEASTVLKNPPKAKGVTTVILESDEIKLGVQLADVKIGSDTFSAVQSVAPEGEGAAEGIAEGMILLGQPSSAALYQRLRKGPYPYAVQFYNLAVDQETQDGDDAVSPARALELAQETAREEAKQAAATIDPPLSSKGTGLVVRDVNRKKGGLQTKACDVEARKGDQVTIRYEARVASPGGPIYDAQGPVRFVLGDGNVVPGVAIGMNGMCQGDVREVDIPSALGYGRAGSDRFDIPGDVRLWWRIELLELVEGEKKFPFR